jgi:GNAT superfamily N-acetyltransferase
LAVSEDDNPVGLAHYRPFARPLAAGWGGFLDDLFVDPAFRGVRVADALIEAVAAEGRTRGWGVIRWITADDNYRGRGVYDRHAIRTMWITYDLKLLMAACGLRATASDGGSAWCRDSSCDPRR